MAEATARRLGTGEVELVLPNRPTSPWFALQSLLGAEGRVVGYRRVVVPPARVPAALAILEWYFGDVRVLEPEVPPPQLGGEIRDAHGVLDLPPELRERAFRALAKVLHPDAGGSNDAFAKLTAWREAEKAGG